MIDLNKVSAFALNIAKARKVDEVDKPGGTVRMLKHCAGEVVEAADAYREYVNALECVENEDERTLVSVRPFSLELADVVMCCLIIAELNGVDMELALLERLEKNKRRKRRVRK